MSAEDMRYTQLPQADGHTRTINVRNGDYSLISLWWSTQNRHIHASHIPWTITVLEEGYKLVTSWHRQCSSCSLINPCNVEDTCHTALHSYPPYTTTVEREATHWSLPDTGDGADAEGTCCRLAVGRKSSEMLTWRLFEVCSLSHSPGKTKCVQNKWVCFMLTTTGLNCFFNYTWTPSELAHMTWRKEEKYEGKKLKQG